MRDSVPCDLQEPSSGPVRRPPSPQWLARLPGQDNIVIHDWFLPRTLAVQPSEAARTDELRVLHLIDSSGAGGAEPSLAELLSLHERMGIASSVVCIHRRTEGFEDVVRTAGATPALPARWSISGPRRCGPPDPA